MSAILAALSLSPFGHIKSSNLEPQMSDFDRQLSFRVMDDQNEKSTTSQVCSKKCVGEISGNLPIPNTCWE